MKRAAFAAWLTAILAPTLPAQFGFDLGGHLPPAVVGSTGDRFAFADLDGDGDADLLDESGWYANDGHARFTLAGTWPLTPARWIPASADLDGDGDADVVLVRPVADPDPRLVVLENAGGGGFVARGSWPLPDLRAAQPADLDGDGDADLLVERGYGPVRIHLWRNVGGFTFAPIATGASGHDLFAVDLEGDGDVDLVGSGTPSSLVCYENDGAGNLVDVSSARFALVGRVPSIEAVADIDADGDLDLLGSYPNLLIREGPRFVERSATHLPPAVFVRAAAFGDIDADGDLDLVLAREAWLNDGTGRFLAPAPPFDPTPAVEPTLRRLVADLDGDGLVDTLADRGALHLNAGGGLLRGDRRSLFAAPLSWYPRLVADFDRDGDPDLLWSLPNLPAWFEGHDGAGFVDATAAKLGGLIVQGVRDLGAADVDGDGDLDVVVAMTGADALWLNDGTGRMVDASARLPSLVLTTHDLAFADVDADGDPDLLVADDAALRLFRNDGTGAFGAPATLAARPGAVRIAVGDLDGDGDPDLVDSLGMALANDGVGGFADRSAAWIPGGGWQGGAICAVDVDGDGALDVVGPDDGISRVHRNDGSGRLAPLPNAGLPVVALTGELSVPDVELDGDADLVDVDGTVWLNDGHGHFTALARVEFATSADLDGDGDDDLLAADGAHVNLLRHVSFPYLARPGRPWSIRVHTAARDPAVPLAFALPAIAFGAAPPVVIPGLGTWRLDVATALPLEPRAIGPDGSRDWSFTIPVDPNLVGVAVHAQALVADPLVGIGLTGATLTTIR